MPQRASGAQRIGGTVDLIEGNSRMAMQQSEESATRKGIQALESAYSGIMRCQQDVQSTRYALAGGYGGCDGNKYQGLLEQWDNHVDTILVNVDQMINELNNTLKEHRLAQGSSNEAIEREYDRSRDVFHELNPDKGNYVLSPMPNTPESGTFTSADPAHPTIPATPGVQPIRFEGPDPAGPAVPSERLMFVRNSE